MTDLPPAFERKFRDLVALFRHRVETMGACEALRYPLADAEPGHHVIPDRVASRRVATEADEAEAVAGDGPDKDAIIATERWHTLTWQQLGERVDVLAAGLLALGLAREDRCGILSTTRYEWILADLAILCAGGATTTLYPAAVADECVHILTDAGCRILFVESRSHLGKLRERRAELTVLTHVILLDTAADTELAAVLSVDSDSASDTDSILTLADLETLGRDYLEANPQALAEVAAAIEPGQLATLIYTSGTTGQPKGVRLVHDCWAYTGEAMASLASVTADDLQYLWLPLAHSFGKMLLAAQLAVGFASAVDGRTERLLANLVEVKPTFMAAAPRIFEKLHSKILRDLAERGGLAEPMFRWAHRLGSERAALHRQGKPPGGLLRFQYGIAKSLVFERLAARFGGRMRFFLSGGAPLAPELAEFFHGAGILIIEGYGLTESSAGGLVNRPGEYRFGTVGKPLPGTDVAINPEDGEILLRSPGVMRGYHGLAEQTETVLGADGWLHTGDIGHLDKDGFLHITDRKKDLIKTSGGKYIAPCRIESRFKALCEVDAEIIIHGDRRNYCTALIGLAEDEICDWGALNGLANKTYAELTTHRRVRDLIQRYIDQLNQTLASYERIRKFAILPHELSIEAGELTSSLKVRRKFIEAKYFALLEALYP